MAVDSTVRTEREGEGEGAVIDKKRDGSIIGHKRGRRNRLKRGRYFCPFVAKERNRQMGWEGGD